MGKLEYISEPKRLGWWNFKLWMLFAVYYCYFVPLFLFSEVGKGSHYVFAGLIVISVLLSLLIPGVTAIKQRVIRLGFKLIVVSGFGLPIIVNKTKLGWWLNGMVVGSYSTLGSLPLSYFIVKYVLFALMYLAPLFFMLAILLSGEFVENTAK